MRRLKKMGPFDDPVALGLLLRSLRSKKPHSGAVRIHLEVKDVASTEYSTEYSLDMD